MPSSTNYRGRFAPSPTGPLHFGSLVAAVGSYLAAKHHRGTWLVRMEDLDTPRCVPGAADDILRTLETFGLNSDEPILYQNQRIADYEDALERLRTSGAVYPCCCTRKEIADSVLHGVDGFIYPGTCRPTHPLPNPPPVGEGTKPTAWRVRTNYLPSSIEGEGVIEIDDALQDRITQHIETEIGDFVVKRADGLFAYQLAVVVDDAHQGITHVVRGADLLASTARQIWLQRLLGLPTPAYMHLPIAVNTAGEKLSKQTLAAPVDSSRPVATLLRVLNFLQQQPPASLADSDLAIAMDWAIQNWDETKLVGIKTIPSP